MTSSPTIAPVRSSQVTRKPYPNYRVIVLNDDFNTFQHVVECLTKYIPGMTSDRAWKLANQIHHEGHRLGSPARASRTLSYAIEPCWTDNGSARVYIKICRVERKFQVLLTQFEICQNGKITRSS